MFGCIYVVTHFGCSPDTLLTEVSQPNLSKSELHHVELLGKTVGKFHFSLFVMVPTQLWGVTVLFRCSVSFSQSAQSISLEWSTSEWGDCSTFLILSEYLIIGSGPTGPVIMFKLIVKYNNPTLTCLPTCVPGRDRGSSEEPSPPLQTSGLSGWSSHWVSQSDERVLEWRPH